MKIAIYLRVSKDELHTENQELQLKEYCTARQYEIIHTYTDKVSGAKEHRPALDELLRDAVARKFDAVLVWKLDRLGRSLQHLIRVVKQFEDNGVNLICSTQNLDTTTASGKLVFYIFGAMAEFERSLISERTKAGIARARAEGKQIGRKMGQKDAKPRKTEGYTARWQNRHDDVIPPPPLPIK